MNSGYMIYQAERPKSAIEQQEIDAWHAQLAAAFARLLRRPRRRSRPASGRSASCPAPRSFAPIGCGGQN
jgi:hypothetical protein